MNQNLASMPSDLANDTLGSAPSATMGTNINDTLGSAPSATMGTNINDVAMGIAPLTPSEVDFVPPLLRSMSTLLRLKGKMVSPSFLISQLAGSQQISIGACLRAIERTGMTGRVLARPTLESIPILTLPCLLLLKNNSSCICNSLTEEHAQVIFPENGEQVEIVGIKNLQENYSGYAVFLAQQRKPDARVESWRLDPGKRWFWGVIAHFSPIYRHVAFASIITNLIAIASPLFVMNVYDRVVPNNAIETLWVLAIGITMAYLIDYVLRTLRSHFVDVAGRNADVVLSSMLIEKVLTMRLDARPESTGALVNNLREFESLRDFFSSSTLLACIDLPFLVIFFMMIGFIGGPLVLLPIAAMPILMGGALVLHIYGQRAAEQNYRHNMQRNALLVEMVNGVETIKSCQAESRMQRLWEAISGISALSASLSRKYSNMAISLATLVTQLVTVGMIIWGVYRISEGLLTVGGLIGCNILVGRAMAPMMQIASLFMRLQNSKIAMQSLDMLMALPSENQEELSCANFGILEPDLQIEELTFNYPNSQKSALKDINLKIRAGEKIGIIGKMGSGKSTLGKLIQGLYQPIEGSIKFGGVDIRQLAAADLRSRIGVLSQDVVLFYGSIRDNIVMGDPSITDDLVMRAASLSGVIDFVRDNPAGFGTQVGEQGKALSGGQRQAVGLTRALIRDPEILILDEPTSNMDNGAEIRLQQRLRQVIAQKTLILITHRLSMLRLVDRVIVMENGKIKLDGPRDKILQILKEGKTKPQTKKNSTQGAVQTTPTMQTTIQSPKTTGQDPIAPVATHVLTKPTTLENAHV